ncbi:phosphomannomutase [Brucella thiophenivorans]|uniref:Phosphoglucomutase/phosphomannomutase, alpha/beta/alpha domain III family protein n=1 Tax=Brucella thiophenivorans TaxID=571255 RepID=A0A256F1H8_9HYPH|nr:phosphomannomutase [Brucella thiophenivorans]OYR08556.1 phosphoglucomutase/phosphomannomutase, alpha/beta/alpha domain III family protein [Brucella thiophenivorans]
MTGNSLKFGTSGLRGLATELNGLPAYAYSLAFVQVLRSRGSLNAGDRVFVGQDLRPSSPDIAALAMGAIEDAGFKAIDCGVLPTPALSYFAIAQNAPCIMITGSHIPDDRNGLKFYRANGEIDKNNEAAISATYAALPADLSTRKATGETVSNEAMDAYAERYIKLLGAGSLAGLKIGVYQHSSVARDLLIKILDAVGAQTVALGRSDVFVPVDTEALRSEDIHLLANWAKQDRFDAIVSTDGDADRPLITDEKGHFVRGDLVGAITSAWAGADTIVTPVTSNAALEECGKFAYVLRTRVGSPYVIAGMQQALDGGAKSVVGFEANGGVLLGSTIEKNGQQLSELPTRDALLPILACLSTIKQTQKPLSEIASSYRFRIALSDRLQNVPQEKSAAFLSVITQEDARSHLFPIGDPVVRFETIDGVKLFFASGNAVHYRASGNAPELRCYVEAATEEKAAELLTIGLEIARNATKDADNK